MNLKINSETVFLFDMDGTWVDTNLANFISYKEANQSIVNVDYQMPYVPNQKTNHKSLKKMLVNLT